MDGSPKLDLTRPSYATFALAGQVPSGLMPEHVRARPAMGHGELDVLPHESPEALHAQRFIAVTRREPSDTQGKLIPMEPRKRVGAEAGTGEEAKMPGEAHTKASEEAAVSYPIIVRSYEPVADLDERLRRIFAVLSLPPVDE